MVRLKDCATFTATLSDEYFNSNMVRLKVRLDDSYNYIFPNFNSNMVRLKVTHLMLLYSHSHNFNSNMVRLKVAFKVMHDAAQPVFQFQYGSIKSQ